MSAREVINQDSFLIYFRLGGKMFSLILHVLNRQKERPKASLVTLAG